MGNSVQDIEAFLIEQLAVSRGEEVSQVIDDLRDTKGIDSLEGVELILAAEDAFGVQIPDDALAPDVCSSLSKLATLIQSRIAQ